MWSLLVAAAVAADPPGLANLDWEAAGREASAHLAAYLRVDTVNPPGNERAGAELLAALLEGEGIPYEIHPFGDPAANRANLVARLEGSSEGPPLCLLSHIDVVTAEADAWPPAHPPLGGTVDADGWIWGRGALDMKGLGMLEVMTLVWLERLAVPLERDVILLAVGDEEVHNEGVQALIAERWDSLRCGWVINEGGLGLRDALFEGQTVMGVSVAEKGVLWARLEVEGSPGHGSVPNPAGTPGRLVELADDLVEDLEAEAVWHPAMLELIRLVGEDRGGVTRWVTRHPWMVRRFLSPSLLRNPQTAALLTDTVHLTGLGGALQPNVLPGVSWAWLDCRVLPGSTPEAVLARLEAAVAHEPGARIEVVQRWPAAESPWEDPLVHSLRRATAAVHPDVVFAPVVSPGFTDSIFLRPLGAHAYGFTPFIVTLDEAATMHGHDERVHRDQVRDGLRILLTAVVDFAGA